MIPYFSLLNTTSIFYSSAGGRQSDSVWLSSAAGCGTTQPAASWTAATNKHYGVLLNNMTSVGEAEFPAYSYQK